MKALLQPLERLTDYNKMREIIGGKSLVNPMGTVALTGCVDAQKLHLIAGLSDVRSCNVIVAADELRAREILEEYRFYDRDVCFFPGKDLIFYQADIHGSQLTGERVRTFRSVIEKERVTVITYYAAMMTLQSDAAPELFDVEIRQGDTLDPGELASRLVDLGYTRVPQAEEPGQFARRGDIIDVFDLTRENPYRIELWGDEVDSVRIFDPYTQRSIDSLQSVRIFPATEFVLRREDFEEGIRKICEESKAQEKKLREAFLTEEAHRLSGITRKLREDALEFHSQVGIDSYIRYFFPEEDLMTFPEWLCRRRNGDVCFYVEDPARCRESAEAVLTEFRESFSSRLAKGYLLPGQMDLLKSGESVAAAMERGPVVCMSTLATGDGYFAPVYRIVLDTHNAPSYQGSFERLAEDLKKLEKKKYKILILTASRTRGARMAEDLRDLGVPCAYSEREEREFVPGEVLISYGDAAAGFEYPMLQFLVLTDNDIFGMRRKKKTRRRSSYKGSNISSLEDLHPGDYVVHETYGLGRYTGIEKIESGNMIRDYVKLEYREGGIVYTLATELDALQKYASADTDKPPKLNRLGTKEWERTKSKTRAAVAEVARDLVELYAKREVAKGYTYSPDTPWQQEFEETFPYEETEDQLTAIRETKADMESDRTMDRLICGDVGFGKTEIALRAAFKAVQENKQVAYLVPTTILAQQHFATFQQRMHEYPVRVELLSRFRTAREVRDVIAGLKTGAVDIVIGTHRLLSKDVEFKDLGLLVIDEEQRFGVAHKEKIKKLRENIDVLTLSATPIPRTLHMSLVGIRDMSLLEEPPEDRLPIQTFVCEQDDELVREAITRELARGGQVYYLFNRVNMIADMAAKIQQMVPNATVAYAHGQMSERELEDVMVDFVDGTIDVLVCTTIIETGMDIPNANTLIIHESDRMGLSQLYQLRGRVGRSNRIAYAFLMYHRDKILTEVAEKRLEAIREFTDLGSGYRIAMRDLEIRGAGNLLGKTQHGHMEAVGYDLYCKMLNAEVTRLKGGEPPEDFGTVINLDVDAFLPQKYIINEEQKLDLYKRIASVETAEDLDALREELTDRFGSLPAPAGNLLRIALMRRRAHLVDLTEVKGGGGEITFTFRKDARVLTDAIPKLVQSRGGALSFNAATVPPSFSYRYPREAMAEKDAELLMDLTEDLLEDMQILKGN
ncbi:MAG: transcription-repair coupling factor [Lachnospiraceae bacterium]|nr:transcription-repair coupling factor [Lachnospiraceae bacterium]